MSPVSVPRFSVCVTSYRSLRFLPDLFASLLASKGPSFEILFLDNGSPDPEAEWVRNHVADPRVHVFEGENTRYFAGGMNFLTKRASGEFLVMLNSDTRVDSDWLQVMDDYLRVTGFEAVQADIREGDDPSHQSPPRYFLDRMGLVVEVDKARKSASGRVFVACGAAFAMRRDVFFELGALDESYRMYWEDIDLCWRANLFGYRIGYAPGALVYHVGGGSGRKAFFQWTHFRVIRNRTLSFTKNAGPGLLGTFLLINIALRVVMLPVNLVLGRVGKAVSEVAAVFSTLYLIAPAIAKRGPIQAGRVVSDAQLKAEGYILPGLKYASWKTLRRQLPGFRTGKKKADDPEDVVPGP